MASRADSAAYRQRRKDGAVVLRVLIDDPAALTEMLVGAGFLQQWDDHDREAVASAVSRFLVAVTRDGVRLCTCDTESPNSNGDEESGAPENST